MKRCTPHSRRFCWFCFVTTISFPVEHFIWERLPGFMWVTSALGL